MIIELNFNTIGETMFVQIERLKKDISKAVYYQKTLLKKGKHVLAYKMGKKIDYMSHALNEMKQYK
jgi:hypothetical protein